MPVATAGAFANSEWIQGSCQDDSGYGVEKTSRQPVAFAAIRRPFCCPHCSVERVSGAQRLAASLAGAVAEGQRVGTPVPCLHGAGVRVEQAIAGGEAADLEELDWLVGHLVAPQWAPARTTPRSRRRFSACGPDRRWYFWRCSSRSTRTLIQIEEREPIRLDPTGEHIADESVERTLRDRPAAQPGDDVVDGHGQTGQCEANVLAYDAARSDRERLLDHDHLLRVRRARSGSRLPARGGSTRHPARRRSRPASRSSSTTSWIVPITDPSATITVSASSDR